MGQCWSSWAGLWTLTSGGELGWEHSALFTKDAEGLSMICWCGLASHPVPVTLVEQRETKSLRKGEGGILSRLKA